jgi:homopolymeric O-antigen transport system ATP-binding protein
MSSEYAIRARHLGKSYQVYQRPGDRLKQFVWRGRRRFYREFWALRDVSFDVTPGATVGIIGRNGSGKSTLLQLICGTLTPTTGSVELHGRVAALLELGAGFNLEFTGRENVFMYGAVLGLTEQEIRDRYDHILAFADIGTFIDMPVKTYSSGMFVRLAFSVAINVDPDVLIIDEALAVGDARFQQRCMAKLRQLQERGVSVLFVSHDVEAVKRLCKHVLILHDGEVVNQGDPLSMANWYLALSTLDFDVDRLRHMQESEAQRAEREASAAPVPAAEQGTLAPAERPGAGGGEANLDIPEFKLFRHGDGGARIQDVFLATEHGVRTEVVTLGQTVQVVVDVEFCADQVRHLIGFYMRDRLGTDVIGINTWQERIDLPEVRQGDRMRYAFTLPIDLKPGYYSLSPSVAYHQDIQQWMDWIENALIFRVVDDDTRRTVFGVFLPNRRIIRVTPLAQSESSDPRPAPVDTIA